MGRQATSAFEAPKPRGTPLAAQARLYGVARRAISARFPAIRLAIAVASLAALLIVSSALALPIGGGGGDTTPPQTTITDGPTGETSDSTPSFSFNSSEAGSTFECQIDEGAAFICSSPHTTPTLATGPHSFSVAAIDAAGNVDETPATRSFSVAAPPPPPDTTPPSVALTAPAEGSRHGADVELAADASDASGISRVEFYVRGQEVGRDTTAPYSTSIDSTSISPGSAEVYAKAYDGAGHPASSASRTITVDPPPPGGIVGWGDMDQANAPSGLSGVRAIAAGTSHSLALKEDGTVVAWGFNGDGQTSVPSGLSGVRAIAAGYSHSLALKDDGTVVAWGGNSRGQTSVPSGLSDVRAIAAGESHSLALRADGTIVGLGAGVPSGLSGVRAITAGTDHSLALKDDGTVVGWGRNASGQTSVPSGLSGVRAIAAGSSYSLALKEDGTVVAWGDNSRGQTSVPSGLSGVRAITAGPTHGLALKTDGTVVGWGGYNYFQPARVPSGLSGVRAIAAGGYHSLSLLSDNTPPTVSLDSPDEGSYKRGSFGLSAMASDDRSGVGRVEFFVRGQKVGEEFFVRGQKVGEYSNYFDSTGVSDGTATISARAVDRIGNVTDSAVRTITIDNVGFNTTIASGPSGTVRSTSASFGFSSSELGSRFECQLDAATTWSPCTSPKALSSLSQGAHTFRVRAIDQAGNRDATPATRTWKVDTMAAQTTITAGPAKTTGAKTASLRFKSSEARSKFACRLDKAKKWSACTSPKAYSRLAKGVHRFQVRATDPAGNPDATPAVRSWTVR